MSLEAASERYAVELFQRVAKLAAPPARPIIH